MGAYFPLNYWGKKRQFGSIERTEQMHGQLLMMVGWKMPPTGAPLARNCQEKGCWGQNEGAGQGVATWW